MRQVELAPHPLLRPYVRLIWCLELDAPAEFGPPERIAPDGIVEMVFHYRTPLALRFAGESFASQPRSSLVSQTRRFVEIKPEGTTGFVSVRFHPWGARHFFGLPLSELTDRVFPAEHLWGRAIRELEERLAGAASRRARVALVERFLLDQLRRHHKADVEALVRAVWSRKGQVPVARLCGDLGLSERQLQRIFGAALGVSPKAFARLTRFLHSCAVLREGSWTTLTEIGHLCGYYDQSHFIAEFKTFAGMTPGQFLAARSFAFLDLV
jgi:AraC-like DNA-binding protein